MSFGCDMLARRLIPICKTSVLLSKTGISCLFLSTDETCPLLNPHFLSEMVDQAHVYGNFIFLERQLALTMLLVNNCIMTVINRNRILNLLHEAWTQNRKTDKVCLPSIDTRRAAFPDTD